MTRRLVGNDKVPPEHRYSLLIAKAVKQGMTWSHVRWWPALDMLRPEHREPVRQHVLNQRVWRAVSGTIGNPLSTRRAA